MLTQIQPFWIISVEFTSELLQVKEQDRRLLVQGFNASETGLVNSARLAFNIDADKIHQLGDFLGKAFMTRQVIGTSSSVLVYSTTKATRIFFILSFSYS